MSTDLSQYHTLYIQTAKDLVQTIINYLEVIKKNSADNKVIEGLHRSFHSLKSQSLVMGFTNLGTINRLLEALFLQIKEGKTPATDELIEMVHEIVLSIKKSIAEIAEKKPELNLSEEIKKLENILTP